MNLITDSAIKTYGVCQRKYEYRYVLELVKDEIVEPLQMGTNIHGALHHLYDSSQKKPMLNVVEAAMIERYRTINLEEINDGIFNGHKILALEVEFDIPILNPLTGRPDMSNRHGGKIDMVLDDGNEGLVLVDHKSTRLMDGAYIDKASNNQQLYGYSIAAERKFKKPVTSLILNILQKPTIRLRKDEHEDAFYIRLLEWLTPDKFHRQEVILDKKFKWDSEQDLWDKSHQIHDSHIKRRFPKNTENCVIFNKKCPYFELCIYDQTHLIGEVYIKKRKHSELKEKQPIF